MESKMCVQAWIPMSLVDMLDSEAANQMRKRSNLIALYIQRGLATDCIAGGTSDVHED